jgi:hypothetical protein
MDTIKLYMGERVIVLDKDKKSDRVYKEKKG